MANNNWTKARIWNEFLYYFLGAVAFILVGLMYLVWIWLGFPADNPGKNHP